MPDTATDWLIPGFAKRGWATKVGGREKIAGKGTLITHLLGKLERGEPTVFGEAADSPVSALIVTEEPEDSLREKLEAANIQRARVLYSYELASLRDWEQKTQLMVKLALTDGHGIVFVDNTSRQAGIEDEAGVEFARAVETLADNCRAAGLALVIDVHHKKGADSIENKTRGGTGVQGAVDVNVEVERVGKNGSRRRRLTAFGRVRASHWVKLIELSDDGKEYSLVEDDTKTEVDSDAQRLWTDDQALQRLGRCGWQYFAKEIGVRDSRTAKTRLTALVETGRAIKHEGSGRLRDEWEPVVAVHAAPY